MKLSISELSYRYGRAFCLDRVSLDFTEPVTALIGPNGAGKSTLVKCVARALSGDGIMEVQGDDGQRIPLDGDFVRAHVSYLPQGSRCDSTITVFETVLLGLLADLSLRVSRSQASAVERELESLELAHLAGRPLRELSGGQAQMAFLAQALIKRPKILLLDEPLNNLDVYRQFSLMNAVSRVSREAGALTLIVMHDIHLAARYADRIAVMRDGRLFDYGTPAQVVTPMMMRHVYRLETAVHSGEGGRPVIEYLDICGREAETINEGGVSDYELVSY